MSCGHFISNGTVIAMQPLPKDSSCAACATLDTSLFSGMKVLWRMHEGLFLVAL